MERVEIVTSELNNNIDCSKLKKKNVEAIRQTKRQLLGTTRYSSIGIFIFKV